MLAVEPHGTADVYDLTVDEAHEFYANGILVSNSDSLRYVVQSRTPAARKPEEGSDEEYDDRRSLHHARVMTDSLRRQGSDVYLGVE